MSVQRFDFVGRLESLETVVSQRFLFAGHETAAQNLAVLESLVNTCEMNGVNPEAYLADVLIRIQTHPNKDILDLMPHRWKDRFAPSISNSLYEDC